MGLSGPNCAIVCAIAWHQPCSGRSEPKDCKMIRLLKRFSGVALVVAFAGMMSSSPRAQGVISVTFPTRVAAAPDFATEVLGDPWDMCNPQDISPEPTQLVGFSGFSFQTGPCRAGGTTMPVNGVADSSVMFLHSGLWEHALNPGKNGRNFPIDSAKYQVLSYKVTTDTTEDPQIYWMHNPSGHPAGDGLGGRVAPRVTPGTRLVVADLTQSPIPGFSAWTDGPVRGFRLDPNSFNAVENVTLHWVRLTPGPNSPLAAKRTISWTGSGATTITVRDNSDGSVFPVVSGLSANSYLWNYGVLAPGSYTLTVTNASGSGSATFSINSPPSIELTNPSELSGADFATTVLGNPWDMSSADDVQITGLDHFTNLSFSGGMLHATNTTNDPIVTLLYHGNNSVPIDTSRFRYLTYWLQVDGPYDLAQGSVARVIWDSMVASATTAMSQDIIVWPGMNRYTIDLASLSTAVDGGLEPVGTPEPWAAGPKRYLRLDPHEFPQARTFHIDEVRLTAKPAAGATFPIQFVSNDADGDAATVSFYYDVDTNPGNGKVLIMSGVPRSAGSFVWNTAGVPQGEYFIYAEATDGVQSLGRYSAVPVQVAPIPPTPTGLKIIR